MSGSESREPYVRYYDWKARIRPDQACRIFPEALAQRAFEPLRVDVAPTNQAFGAPLWPELAVACVSYIRVSQEQPFRVTKGSPPRAPTVPQLLKDIMDGAETIVWSADEMLRQALLPQSTGDPPDERRIQFLRELSHALTLRHLPQEQRDAVKESVRPGFRDNPFGPKTPDSGLSPLLALWDAADHIREELGARGPEEKLRPNTGRHKNENLRALIVDLSKIFVRLTGRTKATAYTANERDSSQQESLFMRFVRETFTILREERIIVRPLNDLTVPSARTVRRCLAE